MSATPRWWRSGLVGAVLLAIVVRVAFTLAVAPDLPPPGDAEVYRTTAHNLASGDGLSYPAPGTGRLEPTAEHPPAFPVLIAVLDGAGIDSVRDQGIALSVVAGAGVAIVALLGRRIGGPVAGLVAAGIAAVHPMWTQFPGLVLSESLYLLLVSLVLLSACELLERPRASAAVLLGGAVGLAALCRPEGVGLVLVVAVPAVLLGADRFGSAVRIMAICAASTALFVVPWLARNAAEFGGWTMSTNSGKTLLGSNCDATYRGPRLGGFAYDCMFNAAAGLVRVGPSDGGTWDAKSFDDELGRSGREYVSDHLGDLPEVVVARAARMWGLAFTDNQRGFDVGEGRDPGWQRAGQWLHLLVLAGAVAGGVIVLRSRSWRHGVVLLGPVVLVTAACLLFYGGTRMRTAAEPSLVAFAGCAVAAVAPDGGGFVSRARYGRHGRGDG